MGVKKRSKQPSHPPPSCTWTQAQTHGETHTHGPAAVGRGGFSSLPRLRVFLPNCHPRASLAPRLSSALSISASEQLPGWVAPFGFPDIRPPLRSLLCLFHIQQGGRRKKEKKSLVATARKQHREEGQGEGSIHDQCTPPSRFHCRGLKNNLQVHRSAFVSFLPFFFKKNFFTIHSLPPPNKLFSNQPDWGRERGKGGIKSLLTRRIERSRHAHASRHTRPILRNEQ